MQRLKEAAEKAKHELSSIEETDINLPFLTSTPSGPVHLVQSLDRATLEEVVGDLIERLGTAVRRVSQGRRSQPQGSRRVLLVGGMTRMPRVREKVKEIFGKDGEANINPDEVVAIGAAVQSSVLSGDVKDVLLLDVTPLTLGIEIAGGLTEPIIKRNTTIPCRKSKIFTTALDNQEMVRVHILQGERELADYNKSLGKLELHGIPPAPRGCPRSRSPSRSTRTASCTCARRTSARASISSRASWRAAGSRPTRSSRWSRRRRSSATRTARGARSSKRATASRGSSTARSAASTSSAKRSTRGPRDHQGGARRRARRAPGGRRQRRQDAHEDLTMAAQRLAEAIYGGLRDEMKGDFDDFDDFEGGDTDPGAGLDDEGEMEDEARKRTSEHDSPRDCVEIATDPCRAVTTTRSSG
jgi:hypothetical protein